MGADEPPDVVTVRLLAYVTPPPVVIMPPEPEPVVVMVVSLTVTVVPSPEAPFRPPLPPYEKMPSINLIYPKDFAHPEILQDIRESYARHFGRT